MTDTVYFVDREGYEMTTGTLSYAEKAVKRGEAVPTDHPRVFAISEAASKQGYITPTARKAARVAARKAARKARMERA